MVNQKFYLDLRDLPPHRAPEQPELAHFELTETVGIEERKIFP